MFSPLFVGFRNFLTSHAAACIPYPPVCLRAIAFACLFVCFFLGCQTQCHADNISTRTQHHSLTQQAGISERVNVFDLWFGRIGKLVPLYISKMVSSRFIYPAQEQLLCNVNAHMEELLLNHHQRARWYDVWMWWWCANCARKFRKAWKSSTICMARFIINLLISFKWFGMVIFKRCRLSGAEWKQLVSSNERLACILHSSLPVFSRIVHSVKRPN